MVTEVDHHLVKTRIKDIVKANASIYDSTGSAGKFVDCFVGRPYNDAISAHPTPYLFITNDDNMEEMEAVGIVESNVIKATKHTIRYMLVMVDQAQDGRQVEKNLDALGKNLMQVLRGKFELRKPSDDSDPKCNYSFTDRVRIFRSNENGKPLQGRVIHLRLEVITS